jgi:hypothetical protein
MADKTPYLSVVVTARNDNHGGNLLGRMQLFVNGLLEQCRRHNLSAELVLVEWNPPADQPRLAEALSWPTQGSPCAVRIIEVPPEIHQRYKYARTLPLYQMIAKNVGIRRAKGEFVLATNIDLLFNHELMRFLGSRQLHPNVSYRVDRHDVTADVPLQATLDEQLEYCQRNRLRLNTRSGTLFLTPPTGGSPVPTGLLSEFWAAWKTAPLSKRLKAPITGPFIVASRLASILHGPLIRWYYGYPKLHMNACGDFTLLSREGWFKLRGYAELDIFSMNLDSLFLHAAYHAGYKEEILPEPMRVYHVEHGSGWSPEGAAKLNARLEEAGIEQLTWPQFQSLTLKMARQKRPTFFSDEDWGLAQAQLPEIVLHSPEPDRVQIACAREVGS